MHLHFSSPSKISLGISFLKLVLGQLFRNEVPAKTALTLIQKIRLSALLKNLESPIGDR
jgi:hypothetical protein